MKKKAKYNVAVVGVGVVGIEMLRVLRQRNFPVAEVRVLARSARDIDVDGQKYSVKPIAPESFDGIDIALFAGTEGEKGAAVTFAHEAVKRGAVVIDNGADFRMDKNVPLVVPEVNGVDVKKHKGIIANPNCSTIQVILPLAVLDKLFCLKKLIVSTYQSVSGSGHQGIVTLLNQRKGKNDKGIYPHIIDLNVIPQIGGFLDSGYCQEEEKMHFESRKILNKRELLVSATTVRVPVIYGHSVSVYAEFENEVDIPKAEEALQNSPRVVYYPNTYITPLDLGSSNDSHICRLRLGTDEKSLTFWNVGHNVRLGAAANAVNILITHIQYSGML